MKKYINKFREFNSNIPEDQRSTKPHSVTAIFETPDEIINAGSAVSKAGYKKFDVYTPYPVHGIEAAMGLRESLVGYVSLLFGILGAGSALLMIWYMSGYDYRNIIGGKPFFGLPAYIPITFELTVLFSAIATVFGMLILFNKLPYISNPLHDTPFMKKVSSHSFGVVIQSDDPMFDEQKVKEFFSSIGGKEISTVYYTVDNLQTKTPIFHPKFMTGLAAVIIVTGIGSYLFLNKMLYMEPFDWMWVQFKQKSQAPSTFFADGYGMRKPVDGTIARGYMPYDYQSLPDSVVKQLTNPLPVSKNVLERGKNRFDIYCSPCHGYYAMGDTRLKGFPNPPSLHTDKVRNWPDGNIYNVITNGQNIMPSYAKQIPREDRWAIIRYIRVLQRSQNAKDEDLPK
jgi:mono/diheme cytochrome c family protein